jgi:hypothetical protein
MPTLSIRWIVIRLHVSLVMVTWPLSYEIRE